MANPVTEGEIRTLLQLPSNSIEPMTLYVEQADVIINEDLAGAGLSDSRLRVIKLNLSAHFAVIALEKGGLTYSKAMESQDGYYQASDQVKLSSTRFGQQAITMDSSGTLAEMASPKGKAEFRVLGDSYDRERYG